MKNGILASGPLTQGNDGLSTSCRAVIRHQPGQFVVHDQTVDEKLETSFSNGNYFRYGGNTGLDANGAFQLACANFVERVHRDMQYRIAPDERYDVVMQLPPVAN